MDKAKEREKKRPLEASVEGKGPETSAVITTPKQQKHQTPEGEQQTPAKIGCKVTEQEGKMFTKSSSKSSGESKCTTDPTSTEATAGERKRKAQPMPTENDEFE